MNTQNTVHISHAFIRGKLCGEVGLQTVKEKGRQMEFKDNKKLNSKK